MIKLLPTETNIYYLRDASALRATSPASGDATLLEKQS